MSKKHLILIGGAIALLWYVKNKSATSAAATAANSPNASTQYTTTQAPQAADWWKFAGSWA